MSVEDLQAAVQRLRNAELRHAIRGVDAEQVQDLLQEAIDSLAVAAREQNELRHELERLRTTNDDGAIGSALLVATRTGERIVAEAHEKAASIVAEAEARAAAARDEADPALVDARQELAQLEDEAVRARSLVADTERRAVQIIQGALDKLENAATVPANSQRPDMLSALRTPSQPPSEIVAD